MAIIFLFFPSLSAFRFLKKGRNFISIIGLSESIL
jgi:hypothetical protein